MAVKSLPFSLHPFSISLRLFNSGHDYSDVDWIPGFDNHSSILDKHDESIYNVYGIDSARSRAKLTGRVYSAMRAVPARRTATCRSRRNFNAHLYSYISLFTYRLVVVPYARVALLFSLSSPRN